jgi:hypothetical protein
MFKKSLFSFLITLFLVHSYLIARQYHTERINYGIDESSTTFKYYGFVYPKDTDKSWYIHRVSSYSSTYIQGISSTTYEIAWSSRTSLTYTDPFNMYKSKYEP